MLPQQERHIGGGMSLLRRRLQSKKRLGWCGRMDCVQVMERSQRGRCKNVDRKGSSRLLVHDGSAELPRGQ
jgi:hypothetical protein